jgi:hypothetical protein
LKVVNSHNSWGKLEEVWLGNIYPSSWYDHLESEVRDCFYELTENTQHDLNIIENKLKQFGITVCRPHYSRIEDFLDANDTLIKPEITPRDYYVTLGNVLYANNFWRKTSPWQQHLDRYCAIDPTCVQNILQNSDLHINGAYTVRVGKDLFVDLGSMDPEKKPKLIESFKKDFLPLLDDYRVNLLFNGGHIDGCFAVLQPGLILASSYYKNYKETFPGWEIINCDRPEFYNHKKFRSVPENNGKWWLPGSNKKSFNNYVLQHAQNWIGNYTETFFEVNCLVVDEKNVIILGENEAIQRKLECHGITTHSVPFRTRTFWDGGMHCLTLDIRRQSKIEDLFPDRSNTKITIYD